MIKKSVQYICGSLIIQSSGGFINGGGNEKEGESEITTPKYIESKGYKIPYISAQDYRNSLRHNFISEYKKICLREKRPINVGDGIQDVKLIDAVSDIFGYFTRVSKPPATYDPNYNYALTRTSPFKITPPVAIGRSAHYFSLDKGFVHLDQGTPLPYASRFYWANMESVFGIEVNRIGTYCVSGDRQEVEKNAKYPELKQVKDATDMKMYELIDQKEKEIRVEALLKSIVFNSGIAKASQFGTDIAPKLIVFASQKGGNPVLGNFVKESPNGPLLDDDAFIEAVKCGEMYGLFDSPIYFGIRKNFLSNDDVLGRLQDKLRAFNLNTNLIITSPIQAINEFLK